MNVGFKSKDVEVRILANLVQKIIIKFLRFDVFFRSMKNRRHYVTT